MLDRSRIRQPVMIVCVDPRAEGEMNDTDARLWHPWPRINRVLRMMLHTRWSASSRTRRAGLLSASDRAAVVSAGKGLLACHIPGCRGLAITDNQPTTSPTREGTMSHCVCGHPEEAHPFGGRCRVPGCECDQFCPIPELSVEWLTC